MKLEFKNVNSEASIEHDEFGELFFEVAKFDVENDGIGSYECHGFRGYDSGTDYAVVTEISLVGVNDEVYDAKKHSHIEKAVQELWSAGKIEAEVEEYEYEAPEYEPEYEGE